MVALIRFKKNLLTNIYTVPLLPLQSGNCIDHGHGHDNDHNGGNVYFNAHGNDHVHGKCNGNSNGNDRSR